MFTLVPPLGGPAEAGTTSADFGISAESPTHSRLVLVILLLSVSSNLLYPGEVFFQSRYLFVLASVLACAIVLYRNHKLGTSSVMLRQLALVFMPLAGVAPSLIWTTNLDRSQEVLLLFFAYSCLVFSLWRCRLRAGALLACLSALVVVAAVVEGHAIYQHFAGLDALKAELSQQTTMDAGFKAALLARAQSGRVFANFALPNTLAGLVTMILPLQGGLLCAGFFRSRLQQTPAAWITVLTNRWTRAGLAAAIVLSVWVLALTQSFGGWVGLFCSLGAMLFIGISRQGRRIHWILGSCTLLLLAALWLAWISHKRGFRLWNLNAAENPITLRLIGYRTALNIFRDFPVTGVGLGNYGTLNPRYQTSPRFVTQFAHNTPLQLLSEGGVVFLAGLLFAAGLALRRKPHRNPAQNSSLSGDPLYLGMLGSLVAWLAHNGLDIDLYFPSLGALGFLVLGLFSNRLVADVSQEEANASWVGQASIIPVGIALGLALFTGIRFQLSRSFLDLAGISASSNNLADANWYARWAVTMRPQDAAGIVFLGKLETRRLKQEGKPIAELLQTLSQSLKEAVRLDPYNAEFHFELSRVYAGLGDKTLSDESRARAVALFPSEPRYHVSNLER
jgi:O-Antigen ligase